MAEILADRALRKIIGKIIIDGNDALISPNSIKLRLGKEIYFHSTDESFDIDDSEYLEVQPGETIQFTSFESIDFSKETVSQFFPDCSLFAIISPTTTMMREGIVQATTKVDVGFKGVLNWQLTNHSSKEIVLKAKEPMFKLSIFKISGEEVPENQYGENKGDSYQGSNGIVHSSRQIPARIPKDKIKRSSFSDLDPKAQLREARYPFNFIGKELDTIEGKFEVISKDIENFKSSLDNQSKNLDLNLKLLSLRIIATLILVFTIYRFLENYGVNNNHIILIGILASALVLFSTFFGQKFFTKS